MIRIHNFARGARGVRLFWLCEEMGLAYERVVVSYPPSAEYLALNPLGNVPFLEDGDGVAINESVAILLYLADRYGPTPLYPASDPARRARVLQMVVFSEATIGSKVNALLTAHFGAPEADKRNWSVVALEAEMEKALAHVENVLGEQEYLVGDFSLADIAITTAIGVWRGALGKPISSKLTAYREKLAKRPAYERAAARQS